MELSVQKFLRNGGTIEELKLQLAIKAKRHLTYPNLILFKYDMIESPMANPIVQECRGIILDESNDWNVVSHSFNKFFNYGEGHAAKVDWQNCAVQEKVDGSLMVLYHYDNAWHVASSGTPDASGDINGFGKFSDMFWSVFRQYLNETEIPNKAKGHSIAFELTTPENRVVVPHSDKKLTVIGGRNLSTGIEISVIEASNLLNQTIPAVKTYKLNNIEQIISTFQAISPLSQEGYVGVDDKFNRIKVKHPGYIALHHAKDGMSLKALVEIARTGETSEVIAAFPEFQQSLDMINVKLGVLVVGLETYYDLIKSIPTQKEFALEAVKTRIPSALFMLRAKKVHSFKEFISKMNVDTLIDIIGLKNAA